MICCFRKKVKYISFLPLFQALTWKQAFKGFKKNKNKTNVTLQEYTCIYVSQCLLVKHRKTKTKEVNLLMKTTSTKPQLLSRRKSWLEAQFESAPAHVLQLCHRGVLKTLGVLEWTDHRSLQDRAPGVGGKLLGLPASLILGIHRFWSTCYRETAATVCSRNL